jgi:RNA polymerase sigma-70 factor, ECF subfamily
MFFRSRLERDRFKAEALPHLGSLYRMAAKLAGNQQQAEDLVQETFQQAWKSFHLYKPNTDCKAWLFRILFRVSNRQANLARRIRYVDLESVAPESLSGSSVPEEKEETASLVEIVSSLPKHYRDALILADVEELTYREVAAVLEVPLGTVMSRLNRARRILRERAVEMQARERSA